MQVRTISMEIRKTLSFNREHLLRPCSFVAVFMHVLHVFLQTSKNVRPVAKLAIRAEHMSMRAESHEISKQLNIERHVILCEDIVRRVCTRQVATNMIRRISKDEVYTVLIEPVIQFGRVCQVLKLNVVNAAVTLRRLL